jgi:hypothetical protein
MRPLILLSACFLASACGVGASAPTVIDGSSAATFDQTLRAAKSDLGPKIASNSKPHCQNLRLGHLPRPTLGRSINASYARGSTA